MRHLILLFTILVILFNAAGEPWEQVKKNQVRMGYNLSTPDKIYQLPQVLYEISGVTAIDTSTLACIQDENGIVFFFDINTGKVVRRLVFGTGGDYEDVACAGKSLYVVRSDALLIKIENFASGDFDAYGFTLNLPGSNIEGICYDKWNNRLLVVPKKQSYDDADRKGRLFIYAFDPVIGKMMPEPAYRLDIRQVERFAVTNGIKFPMKGKKGGKKKPDVSINISAIAIHPVTNRLYLLASKERLLLVIDSNSNIEYLKRLNKKLYPQPEGITFILNGDMFISNEGTTGTATLLRFSHK
jgi:uncharacterized protein YjiK